MKVTILTALFAASSTISATSLDLSLAGRALPNSPKGYTPSHVDCPSDRPTVRDASSLSPNEISWLELRRNNTLTPMKNLLNRLDISGFNAGQYITRHAQNVSALPNIGIAVSGGGWRALENGAGALQAFDSRTQNATTKGHLGGLLQSSTYLAGLSGGAWLVGSIYMNNFSTVSALENSEYGNVWQFDRSVVQGPDTGGISFLDTIEYYTTLIKEIEGKEDAGFEITITDIWGRALSFQLINSTDGGPAFTWSSIALADNFKNGETPFPMVIADQRNPGELVIPGNTTIYEFNPFEMGTWDPTGYGFVPMKYLGTNFTAGKVPSGDKCTIGFDNGGYVMGTSSTLFNQLLFQVNSTSLPSAIKNLIDRLINDFGINNDDIADYSPNPLYGYHPASNPSAGNTTLHLVDGGEDNQNIPFHPLVQPDRKVDVIFAVDSSADTSNHWPNGSSLVETYRRNMGSISNGTVFPSIPDTNTFINLGLNTRPSFFGCNASNITSTHIPPLIVYLPNSPYVTFSNVSTFDLKYNDSQRDAIILNGYNVATMANGTADADWATCVGCAILSRSFDRTGTTVPDACIQCFSKFCWDGTLNSTKPNAYEPSLALMSVNIQSNSPPKLGKKASIWAPLASAVTAAAAWMM